jgi:hypothetical protein
MNTPEINNQEPGSAGRTEKPARSLEILNYDGLIPKTGTFPNLLVQIRNYGAL